MPIPGFQKLTNSTDETVISNLFSGDLVFGIPYFQRAYKWDSKKIQRFQEDLSNLLDIDDSSHFLGAIIVFSKITKPSEPNYYEVIDGQQRLTTCYLALAALCYTFSKHNMLDDAFSLYQRYLVITRDTQQITNAKLICCKEDRPGFNSVFISLNKNAQFYQKAKDTNCLYKVMQASGSEKDGKVFSNFKHFCAFFEKNYDDAEKDNKGSGNGRLYKLYEKLVHYMSVVQIVVKNPTDGPTIFNSLNSKQEPITIGDLVRNEVFSRLSGQDAEIENMDKNIWRPFYERFKQKDSDKWDRVFELYFFPYVLTQDHTVKKGDAFNYLRESWIKQDKMPEEIIADLSVFQDIYLDLCYGTNLCEFSGPLADDINCLSRLGAPTSVYPFLFHVIQSARDGNLEIAIADSILKKVESFLVRRMVCGYEPTGLHATFKALWEECDSDYSIANVVKCIKNHSTVSWPDDDEFKKSLMSRDLYRVKATPYILEEWNVHLGGDIPNLASNQQIEHVLPEHPDKDSQWLIDWTKEEFEKKKDCLANLLPLSEPLNKSLQNDDYEKKRIRYISDSALKAPRDFAQQYEKWTPLEFDDRNQKLWEWALSKWPF